MPNAGLVLNNLDAHFVDMANPHAWLLTAESLHDQASNLRHNNGRGSARFLDRSGKEHTWDVTNRSVYLLGGFALENAIKAFLVFENPSWISNGKLARSLKSHSLTELQGKSSLIPYKNQYRWVLQQFEDGLESWARYPCGLEAIDTVHPSVMGPSLWYGYERVMQAYGRKLVLLLKGGWHGPHGFNGKWTFENWAPLDIRDR